MKVISEQRYVARIRMIVVSSLVSMIVRSAIRVEISMWEESCRILKACEVAASQS